MCTRGFSLRHTPLHPVICASLPGSFSCGPPAPFQFLRESPAQTRLDKYEPGQQPKQKKIQTASMIFWLILSYILSMKTFSLETIPSLPSPAKIYIDTFPGHFSRHPESTEQSQGNAGAPHGHPREARVLLGSFESGAGPCSLSYYVLGGTFEVTGWYLLR